MRNRGGEQNQFKQVQAFGQLLGINYAEASCVGPKNNGTQGLRRVRGRKISLQRWYLASHRSASNR